MRQSPFVFALVLLATATATATASAPASAAALEAPGRVVFSATERVPVSNVDAAGAIAAVALPDGGAVLAGGQEGKLELARLHTDGRLVASFGNAGIARPVVPGGFRVAQVLRRPDGGVLLVGSTPVTSRPPAYEHLAALALTVDGAVDRSYGTDGLATTAALLTCACGPAAFASDGSLLVTGGTETDSGPVGRTRVSRRAWIVTRLTPAGRPDTTFGADGLATIPVPPAGAVGGYAVGSGPGGRILTFGRGSESQQLWALTANGALDPTYHGGSPVEVQPEPSALRVNIRPDGVVDVVAPYSVARFGPDGAPDLAFGRSGRASLAGLYDSSSVPLALEQPDGSIIVVQPTSERPHPTHLGDAFVFRLSPRGVRGPVLPPQLGFGGGLAAQGLPQSGFVATSLLPRPDGGVLVVGGTTLVRSTGEGQGVSAGFFSAAALTSGLLPDPAYGGPAQKPAITLRVPAQRVRSSLARRRVLVQVRARHPGLLVVRVRDGGRHVVARATLPIFRAGTTTVRIPLTRNGPRLLRPHRRGRSFAVGFAFRDILAQNTEGLQRIRLR